MMRGMRERRRLERYELSTPAEVQVELGSGSLLLPRMLTRDISSGGAFVLTDARLPLGIGVRVEITIRPGVLPGREFHRKAVVKLRGRVIRVEKDGVAIRFERGFRMQSLPACGQN